ncbi:sigma-54-dependent Fis family transcriptional regulator [Roseateles sp. BYS180W]|uniref:Sigma-54-dependent Fis family transcriptional regulator n=1 Tax=Roseateles rivi TaxID=3299028 RepID=A0ABW7FS15_9BURK
MADLSPLPGGPQSTLHASLGVQAPHDDVIRQAHHRSAAFGLDAHERPDFAPLAPGWLATVREENRLLYQHASPVMETLHEQIANTHSMVLLTSRSGLILHSLGDADFLERATKVALMPGVDWSERSKGTNAVGTALAEERAVVVHGRDHYLHANQFLTCSCTPILDPYGKVVGALDVTGDERSYHQHTMALVRMSAQMIENRLFAHATQDSMRLYFHARAEFLGTLMEGIAAFTPDGRFLCANRSAQFQLGLSNSALRAHTFASLFGLSVSQLHDGLRQAAGQPLSLCLHNGVTVVAQVRVRPAKSLVQGWAAPGASAGAAPPAAAMAQARPALSRLRYLNTGDPQLAAVLQKLQRVQGSDIPVMILGETGTGKDLLAQAIHNDSPRAARPFVSINCASIPETLIESELFGYEEGAFTGARRRGAPGRIQQAHGGTLFLDEIGDMLIQLQARLLRVLQERRVTPLGSSKEYEVDVALVCATNKNLKPLMAQGLFREDLYYRLNGLVVRLPALRERTDFDVVVHKILTKLCSGGTPLRLSPQVLALFHRCRWPGNVRQLHNLLRTAVVMAGAGPCIDIEHLPDDFFDELQDPDASAAPQQTASAEPAREAAAGARLQDVALQAMVEALRQCHGNVSQAARLLGVSRNTIYRKKDRLPPGLLS